MRVSVEDGRHVGAEGASEAETEHNSQQQHACRARRGSAPMSVSEKEKPNHRSRGPETVRSWKQAEKELERDSAPFPAPVPSLTGAREVCDATDEPRLSPQRAPAPAASLVPAPAGGLLKVQLVGCDRGIGLGLDALNTITELTPGMPAADSSQLLVGDVVRE